MALNGTLFILIIVILLKCKFFLYLCSLMVTELVKSLNIYKILHKQLRAGYFTNYDL